MPNISPPPSFSRCSATVVLFELLYVFDQIIIVMNQAKANIPPKGYAVKREKPKLRKEIEEALTNNYGAKVLDNHEEDTHIDTYYIHEKDTYYQGNWKGGIPHGKGKAFYPDGSYYIGMFQNGEAHDSKGILIFPNGAIYEGNVKNNKLHGTGRLLHKKSYEYKGEWRDNKPEGEGMETFGDGSIYQGTFVKGQKHCFQDRTFQSKKKNPPAKMAIYQKGDEVYKGQFKEGVMYGYGELTNKKKNLFYRGEFVNGQKVGFGSLRTEKGTLTGYFKNDTVTGEGQFQWNDGRKYTGSFKNSKFDGEGIIRFPKGNMLKGTWKEGESQSLKAVYKTNLTEAEVGIGQMFGSLNRQNKAKVTDEEFRHQQYLKEGQKDMSNLFGSLLQKPNQEKLIYSSMHQEGNTNQQYSSQVQKEKQYERERQANQPISSSKQQENNLSQNYPSQIQKENQGKRAVHFNQNSYEDHPQRGPGPQEQLWSGGSYGKSGQVQQQNGYPLTTSNYIEPNQNGVQNQRHEWGQGVQIGASGKMNKSGEPYQYS